MIRVNLARTGLALFAGFSCRDFGCLDSLRDGSESSRKTLPSIPHSLRQSAAMEFEDRTACRFCPRCPRCGSLNERDKLKIILKWECGLEGTERRA